ncbi:MAG: hypothetical protein AAF387_05005 [Pseudomonadota bacterium]
MEYSIYTENPAVCEVQVFGKVVPNLAIEMLDEVWQHELYQSANGVLWDIERCVSYPDFNEFVPIINHIRRNKPKTGPHRIAFYSSTFENSMLVRVFQSFARPIPNRISFFSIRQTALDWCAAEASDAA